MSTYLDASAMAAALKELYNGQSLINATYKENPLLALLPKDTDFGGSSMPLPLRYNNSQGRSSTFATAQTNQQAPSMVKFAITTVEDYSIATVANKVLEESKGNAKAFLGAAKINMDSARDSLISSLASALYRDGTGTIGKIASGGITSGVITLDDDSTVTQFEVGMTLQANSTSGGGTTRAGTGYVISVDRDAGTVTVASSGQGGSAGTPSGWAAGDFLSVSGDLNEKISGLAAWIPSSAPSATSFFGVDRTKDVTRLGGIRWTGTSQSIEEALSDAQARCAREGGSPMHCFMSFESFAALVKSLSSKVQYVNLSPKEAPHIGFEGVKVNGHKGPITVIPDRNCPGNTAYLLQLDTWKLWSTGPAPRVLTYDMEGLQALRVANADALEMRFGYYAQLACNMPGANAVVSLSA